MSKLVSRAGSQHMSQARTKLPVYRPSIQCFLLGTVQYYRVEPDEEALERAGASDSRRRGRGRHLQSQIDVRPFGNPNRKGSLSQPKIFYII